MTVDKKLTELTQAKQNIKTALKTKGYTDSSVKEGVMLSAAKMNEIAPFIEGIETSSVPAGSYVSAITDSDNSIELTDKVKFVGNDFIFDKDKNSISLANHITGVKNPNGVIPFFGIINFGTGFKVTSENGQSNPTIVAEAAKPLYYHTTTFSALSEDSSTTISLVLMWYSYIETIDTTTSDNAFTQLIQIFDPNGTSNPLALPNLLFIGDEQKVGYNLIPASDSLTITYTVLNCSPEDYTIIPTPVEFIFNRGITEITDSSRQVI